MLDFQVMPYLFDQGSAMYETLAEAEDRAKRDSARRPLAVYAIQHSDGNYEAVYINGKLFLPVIESEMQHGFKTICS